MKADRAQLTAERAKAHAERKVKLQEKINQLDSKIQARLERARQRREAAEAQEKAKVEFLQARAAVMKANAPHKHVGPPCVIDLALQAVVEVDEFAGTLLRSLPSGKQGRIRHPAFGRALGDARALCADWNFEIGRFI